MHSYAMKMNNEAKAAFEKLEAVLEEKKNLELALAIIRMTRFAAQVKGENI